MFLNADLSCVYLICCQWEHINFSYMDLKISACILYAEIYLEKGHWSNMVGCDTNAVQNYTNNIDNVVDHTESHIVQSS